jgi:hypothetical protein
MAINYGILSNVTPENKVITTPGVSPMGGEGFLSGALGLASGLQQYNKNQAVSEKMASPQPAGDMISPMPMQPPGGNSPPLTAAPIGLNNLPIKNQGSRGLRPIDVSVLPKDAHPDLLPTMQGITKVEAAKYNELGKPVHGDRAYGRYQIMGANIPSWSKEALGHAVSPEEFLANPKIQDQVAAYHINKNLKSYSPQDTASIWFSGRPAQNNNRRDGATGVSVPQYINRFNAGMNEFKSHATEGIEMSMKDSYNRGYKSPYYNENGFTTGTPPGSKNLFNPNDPWAPRRIDPIPQSGPLEMAMNSRYIPETPDFSTNNPIYNRNVPLRDLTPEQIAELMKNGSKTG